jgi:mannose-6-phosphate isomerase-like protein (cupin superfamily)
MRIARKESIQQPLETPTGEVIYELIGAPEASGGAQKHSVAAVVIPPGKSSERHYHLVAEETYFMLRGTARMIVDAQEFRLEAGEACLIEPGEQHQIWNTGGDDLEFIAVCAPPWVPEDSVFE